jgi:mono/diheme cytochrome c family protein
MSMTGISKNRWLPFAALLLVLSACGDPHVAKGKQTFAKFCSPCHGTGGAGDGYNAVNLDPHARDLTDKSEEYMAKLDNQEIYDVISQGGRGVDLAPLMPSWGKVFSEEELWSLVAYIRTLHPYKGEAVAFSKEKPYSSAKPKAAAATEAEFDALMAEKVTDDAAREALVAQGEEGFADFGCIGCHKVGESGGALGPNLSRVGFMLQPQFIYRWVRNPQSFKPKTRMPNLGLEPEEALAVTLYASTLKGTAMAATPPSEAAPAAETPSEDTVEPAESASADATAAPVSDSKE